MASAYKAPPAFTESKPYSRWVDEVKAWQCLTDLAKSKQALAVALTLDEKDSSGIRDKVFSDIPLDTMKSETGMDELIKYMDKIFKKDQLSEAYEAYTDFDRFRCEQDVKMETYVLEFEKRYNKTKKFQMELPTSVLSFKLLDNANLDDKERKLVLTGVDYSNTETLFTQMSSSLKKFFGQQAFSNTKNESKQSIKLEAPTLVSEEDEQSFYTGNRWQSNNFRGRKPRFGYGRGYGSNNNRVRDGYVKKVNPIGADGHPLKCRSCESIRHMVRDCPDAYENSKTKTEKAVLFTGNLQQELEVLTCQAINCAVLDSACTSTVAGSNWMKCYTDSLNSAQLQEVTENDSETVFKFGSGCRMKSLKQVTFPCKIAGVNCTITTDIVDSDIPLLLSKTSMKKASVKLDLENDVAEIFGNVVNLQCTDAGHYCIELQQCDVPVKEIFTTCEENDNFKSKYKIVEKLHKQFAHPSSDRLKSLLKDSGMYDVDYQKCIDKLSQTCDICKRYKRSPSRPVVCLPIASEFNEAVAMDLKKWKDGVYFLHMIDMATRFSLASVIHNKTPSVIIDQVMTKWIGGGFGTPKKFLADNGGEFANDDFRDMCENLNVEVMNTAAYSPWQNGICERNHAVVDDCVSKILEDFPNMKLNTALAWAVNAKNSLQMVYGWSPYQLVFGSNPNLPSVFSDKPPALEGCTINKTFAQHLNALHSGRRAFVAAESAERIRRALRHQIRVSNEIFHHGDKVYFKRDDSNKWRGPGKVIGQDGKIVFVRHGSVYVRVPTCRLLHVGNEFAEKQNNEDISMKPVNRDMNKQMDDDDDDDIDDKILTGENIAPEPVVNNQPARDNIDPIIDNNIDNDNTVQLPRVNDNIIYRLNKTEPWIDAKVVSRGGKATGKYWSYLNVQNTVSEENKGLDFGNDDLEWKYKPVEDTNCSEVFNMNNESTLDTEQAKLNELSNWKNFHVYEEVPDIGQQAISTRWVLTNKESNGTVKIKARLVARGFEEDSVRSDSPTACKETIRLFLSVISILGWSPNSIDIKAAFLQGDQISREVFLVPPPEANCDGTVWKLNKCVYGLADASRNWFLSVCSELKHRTCVQSIVDPAFFFWYDDKNELAGIFILHVDDFIWAGKANFKNEVVDKITEKFVTGKIEENTFRYIGLEINQCDDGIVLHQDNYINSVQSIKLMPGRAARKFDDLNSDEIRLLRETIGQINWVATQSRPDLSFDVLDLTISLKQPVIDNILKANKVVKKLKGDQCKILFPKMSSLNNVNIVVFSDASYANMSDGVSSAEGYIVLLVGTDNKCAPIAWSSRKIRRVVKSTIASETLAIVDGLDTAYFIRSLLSEMLFKNVKSNIIPLLCYTDNKSIFENIYSTKLVQEKRLRIDIASIKQMLANRELSKVSWIPSTHQIADCLTKKGATSKPLLDVLNSGQVFIQ